MKTTRNWTRAYSLVEVAFAMALASTLIGVHGTELVRQQVDLRLVRAESHTRSELLTAYERLRAGQLAPPDRTGEPVHLPSEAGVDLTIERLELPDLKSAVVAVRLRAGWRDPDGDLHWRELTTLVEEVSRD